MNYLIYLFPIFFIGMWILVTFVIAKMGWAALVENYQFDDTFTGEKIGLISASINSANYKNSLILKYNDEGIYLKPIFLFRLFHKPVLIPWKEIKDIRDKKILFITIKELTVGHPSVAFIGLTETVYDKIRNNIDQHFLKH